MAAFATLRRLLAAARSVKPSTWIILLFAFALTLPWGAYAWLATVARAERIEAAEHTLAGLAAAYGEHATVLTRLGVAVAPSDAASPTPGARAMADFARALNVPGVRYALRPMAGADAKATTAFRVANGVISVAVDRPAVGMTATASLGEDIALKGWRERTRLEAAGLLLRTLLGAGIGVFLVRQLRARERLQAELAVAHAEAQRASHAKSEFLANMSHELRTPLNAIIGFSEVIKMGMFGPLSLRYRDYGRDIFNSGSHLLGLINDVLDLSKLEAGQFELYEESVDLSAAIRASLRLVETHARKGMVRLSASLPAELPLIRADDRRMRQVFINLFSNAVKFTPAGGEVEVSAALVRGALVVTVRDTGIGMAPAQIAKALEPFGQIESKVSRKYEGTGLGLPLAKQLVELHGGTLGIESEEGFGTTVVIVLPPERILAGVLPAPGAPMHAAVS